MHQRFVVFTALVLLTESLSAAVVPSLERRDFLVKAGVMEAASTSMDKLRETHELTMDPARRPGWCFTVDPPTAEPYEVYSVHYLPGVPTSLTGDFKGMPPDHAGAGMKTATARADGIRPFCFDFERGDPLGEYRVNVFINGALNTTLRLQVVEPTASAGDNRTATDGQK